MISVIIPSYNSEHTISAVLQALQEQTYRGDYEIILVDSSQDRTPEIVHQQFPDIKFFHFEKKTDPGTARNFGVEQSAGDLILFIDSDCRAAADWIEKIVQAHQKHPYAAIGGAVENGNDPRSQVAWAGYMAEFREYLPQYKARLVPHIPTCNISYKRAAFTKIKAFNPRYYPQEDLEFNFRLRQEGLQIYFDPQIRIFHHHRTNLKAFFIHQKRVGTITSKMLKILPLAGSSIVRSKGLAVLALPLLAPVKWFKTLYVFLIKQPKTIITHLPAVVIFTLGLFPWIIGFSKGVFSNEEAF